LAKAYAQLHRGKILFSASSTLPSPTPFNLLCPPLFHPTLFTSSSLSTFSSIIGAGGERVRESGRERKRERKEEKKRESKREREGREGRAREQDGARWSKIEQIERRDK
jgi:hypothetical protein